MYFLTLRKLASYLGMGETETIHKALYDLAQKVLPKYEQDEGELSLEQINSIKKYSANSKKLKVKSSLLDIKHEKN